MVSTAFKLALAKLLVIVIASQLVANVRRECCIKTLKQTRKATVYIHSIVRVFIMALLTKKVNRSTTNAKRACVPAVTGSAAQLIVLVNVLLVAQKVKFNIETKNKYYEGAALCKI